MLTRRKRCCRPIGCGWRSSPQPCSSPAIGSSRPPIERLRAAELRLLDGALETDPPDALHERGVRFHESIVGACRNPFFLDALRRINRVRRLLSYRSMVVRDRYREQCREHLDILGCSSRAATTEAAEALRAHLVTTIRNLDRIRPLMEH